MHASLFVAPRLARPLAVPRVVTQNALSIRHTPLGAAGGEAARRPGGGGGGDPTSKEVASWGEGGGGRRSCPSSVFVCARHSGRSSGGCASWELGSIPSQRRRREHHRAHVDCRLPASGEGGGAFLANVQIAEKCLPRSALGAAALLTPPPLPRHRCRGGAGRS